MYCSKHMVSHATQRLKLVNAMKKLDKSAPIMLNYYVYIVTLAAYVIAVMQRKVRIDTFVTHAVLSFMIMLGFNFFVHCMIHGDCMRSAISIVTLLQVLQVVWFLRQL